METHELKEIMVERFILLDKKLDTHIERTNAQLEKMDSRVINHDRWLWFIRGIVAVFAVVLSLIGIKIRM